MQTQQRYYTPEEYLVLEEAADFRHEYQDGEIVPMTGGSINHNRILLNASSFFKFSLRGTEAEPFTSDLRLWIPRYRQYTYPDLLVIQGQPVFQNDRTDTVMNPLLIVEILSKSTQGHDRTDKFRYYRSIPEFREYVLINQYEPQLEQYQKTDQGQWLFQEYEAGSETITFAAIDLNMAIADIYEGVNFD
jgi:Uma2 family endonuclease